MRLSKLQKHIIATIAKHIININECGEAWVHFERQETSIGRKRLLHLCLSYWTESEKTKMATVNVSFSRALRSLCEKGLIGAEALAWHYVTGEDHYFTEWQGGGRLHNDLHTSKRPIFRRIDLTEAGWKLAHEMLGEQVGRCEHLRD